MLYGEKGSSLTFSPYNIFDASFACLRFQTFQANERLYQRYTRPTPPSWKSHDSSIKRLEYNFDILEVWIHLL